MKTKIIMTIAFLLGICALAKSQPNISGIYKTSEDFDNQKMMYAIDCKTESHKIKLNEFLSKDYITVIHEKQSHNLKKNEIFGYKDCEENIYRFVGNSHYQILNPTEETLLYKHELQASKNQKGVINYYFSKGAVGEVQDLTLTNLKNAYPNDHKFHDALDAEFKSDDELANYDSFHKMYKINRLYVANK